MNDVISIVVALIGGLTGIGALLTVRVQRRKLIAEGTKTEADAVKIISDTAVSLLAPAREEIAQLKAELAVARKDAADVTAQLATAQAEIQGLRNQVSEMSKELAEQRDINDRLRGGL